MTSYFKAAGNTYKGQFYNSHSGGTANIITIGNGYYNDPDGDDRVWINPAHPAQVSLADDGMIVRMIR